MTEREAFMKAILEKPEDDTPRLMYADWLKEQGDPLGDFIEVQIRLHHEGKWTAFNIISNSPHNQLYHRDDKLTGMLYNKCYELINENGGAWVDPVYPATVKGWSRGFPSYIQCYWDHWLEFAPEWTVSTPIEKVLFQDKTRNPKQHYRTRKLQKVMDEYSDSKPESFSLGDYPRINNNMDFSRVSNKRKILKWLLPHYWPNIDFVI